MTYIDEQRRGGEALDLNGDVAHYFRERLVAALKRQRVEASEVTRVYLIDLLSRFAVEAPVLSRPFALLWAEAQEVEGIERLRLLRTIGDTALYVSGFFPDHLDRRGISASYVQRMGGHAYQSAGELSRFAPRRTSQSVFAELAQRFGRLTVVLDEVRETTDLRTPQDIVRLYERWKRTRAPHLAARLRDEGVFIQASSSLLH